MSSDPAASACRQALLDVYRDNFAIFAKYGVRIAIGSGQFDSAPIREALAIHKAGLMDSATLLRALSSVTAGAIFPERAPSDLTGAGPSGFLVVTSDPIADFGAIQRIHLRVKGGHELR